MLLLLRTPSVDGCLGECTAVPVVKCGLLPWFYCKFYKCWSDLICCNRLLSSMLSAPTLSL